MSLFEIIPSFGPCPPSPPCQLCVFVFKVSQQEVSFFSPLHSFSLGRNVITFMTVFGGFGVFVYFKYLFIYSAALGLHCAMLDLRCHLRDL